MLTFQNPLMLWGLLGLAVPVLLHLIHRELFRPVRFPSIRFILKGKLPFQKRRVPRDLLLLALRLLLFAALIFALARPEWQPRDASAAAAEGAGERVVFLVDLSASMGGWNSREEALAEVERTLAERSGADAGLVLSSDRVVETLAPTREHGRLLELLEGATPETVAGNHREGVATAVSLLGDGAARRTLAVVSDLQVTAWEGGRLPEVPRSVRLEWLTVGAGRSENAAVVRVRSYPRGGDDRHIQAELRNFGPEEVERTVTLTLGNRSWDEAVTLPPGRTVEVAFDVASPEAARGVVSLEADPFEADDRFHFWAGRPPPLRVLAVAPFDEEPEKAEEVFFLRSALETRGEGLWQEFQVAAAEPGDLPADWSPYRAVFLLGAPTYFEDAQWAALRDYLEGGGIVVTTPGREPGRLSGALRERGILDAEYLGTARADRRGPATPAIDWINPESPLDRVFNDDAARSLQMVNLYRYARFDPNDPAAREWLRSSNGDPLLIYRPVGRGSFFLSGFPFLTAWGDLPLTGGFLPLIRELVAGDLPADHGIVREETGFSVARVAERMGIPADDPFWQSADPREPGVHAEGDSPLEVNLARRESVLETAAPVELARAMRPREGDGEPRTTGTGTSGAGERSTRPLWHGFALAAALFFLAEMLIAALTDRSGGGLTSRNRSVTDREVA